MEFNSNDPNRALCISLNINLLAEKMVPYYWKLLALAAERCVIGDACKALDNFDPEFVGRHWTASIQNLLEILEVFINCQFHTL
jgi:hypothetical protein